MAGKPKRRVSQRPPNRLQRQPPSLVGLDMSPRVGNREYEARLGRRQHDLKEISLAYRAHRRRAAVVFEGWVELPPGDYVLRAVIRNSDTRAEGTVEQAIRVPGA